jgi:hypothetical protein
MSPAYRNHGLERPLHSSFHPTGDPTAPGPEILLPGKEDPSPKSGVRTGLVLMALLAFFSVFTVSLYSPSFSGDGGLPAFLAAALVMLLAALLLLSPVISI